MKEALPRAKVTAGSLPLTWAQVCSKPGCRGKGGELGQGQQGSHNRRTSLGWRGGP